MDNTEQIITGDPNDIAIIGLSGRFPGARHIDEFWHNLCNGIESISFFTNQELKDEGIDSDAINDSSYVKAKPIIEGAEMFDAQFFQKHFCPLLAF